MSDIVNTQLIEDSRKLLIVAKDQLQQSVNTVMVQIQDSVSLKLSWTHYRRLIRSESSQSEAKYSVLAESKQLFSSKYLPYLPTEEELQKELLRERNLLINDGENE
ncbi:hypothetical protein ACOJTA_00900 [Malaciobacter sp. WC5094]